MTITALADPALGVRPAGARPGTCHHFPPCPAATAPGRDAARTVAAHPEQGWSLLCNGVVLFDDTGELLPGGQALPPRPCRVSRWSLPATPADPDQACYRQAC
jgi:Family of unknown function (DUF5999)